MAQRADIQNDLLRPNHLPAVAVPDLQIRGWGSGGGGGGRVWAFGAWDRGGGGFGPSDPEIRGAPVSKRFFSPQGGGGEPPLDPPLDPPLEKQISCMQL